MRNLRHAFVLSFAGIITALVACAPESPLPSARDLDPGDQVSNSAQAVSCHGVIFNGSTVPELDSPMWTKMGNDTVCCVPCCNDPMDPTCAACSQDINGGPGCSTGVNQCGASANGVFTLSKSGPRPNGEEHGNIYLRSECGATGADSLQIEATMAVWADDPVPDNNNNCPEDALAASAYIFVSDGVKSAIVGVGTVVDPAGYNGLPQGTQFVGVTSFDQLGGCNGGPLAIQALPSPPPASPSFDLTDFNNYKAVLTPGGDLEVYVNGNLEVTYSYSLLGGPPSGMVDPFFGFRGERGVVQFDDVEYHYCGGDESACAPPTCVNLLANADSYNECTTPNTNYGTSDSLLVGHDGNGTTDEALFDFDLSAIPAGSTIVSGELTLTQVTASSSTVQTLELATAGNAWVENTVTWANLSSPGSAQVIGSGPNAGLSGEVTIPFTGPVALADFEKGLVLTQATGVSTFRSHEGLSACEWPKLHLCYKAPPQQQQ